MARAADAERAVAGSPAGFTTRCLRGPSTRWAIPGCRCPDQASRRLTAASVGSGALKGAAATSASNAWTVSSAATGKALIKR